MNLLESTTQSFVVKIWLEETAAETGQHKWRGRITHVGSRDFTYFEDLAEITHFVASFLEESAGGLSRPQPLFQRLKNYFTRE